jgi:hypothetical protein
MAAGQIGWHRLALAGFGLTGFASSLAEADSTGGSDGAGDFGASPKISRIRRPRSSGLT